MLIERVKAFENIQSKLEQQDLKYKKSYEEIKEATKALEIKVGVLKEKSIFKNNELKIQIKNLEERISEKVYSTATDDKADSDLRNLSIELDLYKRQQLALSNELRKTIIVNCRKEIERVKKSCYDAYLQFYVLNSMYDKFHDFANKINKEISNKTNSKKEDYRLVYAAVASASIKGSTDMLKQVAEFVFNTDIRDTLAKDDSGKTAHEVVSDYLLKTIYPEAIKNARIIIDKI